MYRFRQARVKSLARYCSRNGRIAVVVLNNDTWWMSRRIEQLGVLYASSLSLSFSIVYGPFRAVSSPGRWSVAILRVEGGRRTLVPALTHTSVAYCR